MTVTKLSDEDKKARKRAYDKSRMATKRKDPDWVAKRRNAQRTPEARAKNNARAKKWRQENLEYAKVRARAYHDSNPDVAKNNKLKRAYGITLAERDQMLAAQGGVCGICKTDSPGPRDWHTDHCHDTGRVRGILCHSCNTGIGGLKHNAAFLSNAIQYLN